MELSKPEENVEQKLDKLNSALSSMLKDLNTSQTDFEGQSYLSQMNSFCEDIGDYRENTLDYSISSLSLPQEFLEKFQENLTEIDRLNMKIEDLLMQNLRSQSPLFEISLTKDQINSLYSDLQGLLSQDFTSTVLKLGKNLFILESPQKTGKVIYSELPIPVEKSIDESLNSSVDTNPARNNDMEFLKLQADYELKCLQIAKKEENLRKIEETLGHKMQKVELLKAEYHKKIAEISHNNSSINLGHKKLNLSQGDIVQESIFPISRDLDPKNIQQALGFLENYVKDKENWKKINKENELEDLSKDVSVQYTNNRKKFVENLAYFGKFSNKENYILSYLKEQSEYLDQKFYEIQEYEKYLQEIWVETIGHENPVNALHKASRKNFMIQLQLKKEREILDEKIMRTHKLIEITREENKRLEFHRKKIINERQQLANHQSDIENAYEKLKKYCD